MSISQSARTGAIVELYGGPHDGHLMRINPDAIGGPIRMPNPGQEMFAARGVSPAPYVEYRFTSRIRKVNGVARHVYQWQRQGGHK